eukprot:GHRR01017695.1.p2 GENE.GHRR01017695.1~~GHRR01017695.1.p2  ORF type:complete len:167 (+),score=79.85 GHRR01017695.1:891-1391(+)
MIMRAGQAKYYLEVDAAVTIYNGCALQVVLCPCSTLCALFETANIANTQQCVSHHTWQLLLRRQMREQQAKEGNSGKASSNRAPGRVGLGKLGPLRYRSSRKHSAATAGAQAPQPARAATTVGASPPDQAAVGAAAAAAGGTLQEASSQNQQAAAAAANDGADATR